MVDHLQKEFSFAVFSEFRANSAANLLTILSLASIYAIVERIFRGES